MANSNISFVGGLVKISKPFKTKGEFPQTGVFFTIARNYSSYNRDTKTWEELGAVYQDCVVYGKMADNFLASNVPNGTPLNISGTLRGTKKDGFTTKSGIEVPESFIEIVNVDDIGISFQRNTLSVDKAASVKSGNSSNQNYSQPQQTQKSAPEKAETKSVEQMDDIFGESNTNDDALKDADSLFDDLFD